MTNGTGYLGIGIYNGKRTYNFGTLVRTARAFGADFVFSVGHRITQIGDKRVSVIVREGERASSRHSVYVPRSPSIGGRSDEGALPESLSASIDADHWISLELDEDNLSKMKGTFSFNEVVRFPGEFESIDVTCDGSL